MKSIFIIITVFFITFTANACANFSGDYRWGENWTLRMVQNSCESIMLIDDNTNEFEVKFNGEDIYMGSLGNSKLYTNNLLVNEKWLIRNTTEQLLPNGDMEITILLAERVLNSDGDIVEFSQKQGEAVTKYVFKKIK